MNKKILVLEGSPRKKGNSDILSDAFISGATQSGFEAEKMYIQDMKIHGCLGCGACQKNGGTCVQKDDMQMIYDKMMAADTIVFASPVYFYSWTAQIKAVVDRTFAIEKIATNKRFYLISVGAAPEESYMENMTKTFELYVSCFRGENNRLGGIVYGLGTNAPGDVKDTEAMEVAYALGANINR